MSLAHSVYAWGAVAVVLLSTLFLHVCGTGRWWLLAMLWTALPLTAFMLFLFSDIPELAKEDKKSGGMSQLRDPVLILCVLCIFLGGASENTMTQWCSGFLESALGISKLWGDVFGVALFAVMLATGRTLYARFGKRISRHLLFGFAGAFVCYAVAAFSSNGVVGLIACVLTGYCVAMLWPGTLIYTAELVPGAGVAVYALLAAGGDLGGSVAPQLVGTVTDAISARFPDLAASLALTPEQFGFKVGMLIAAVFPLLGVVTVAIIRRKTRK